MPMRPYAFSALLLVAAVGCGVPDNAALIERANAAGPSETPKTPDKKPDAKKPDKPGPDVKPAVEDPVKLGMKITDSVVGTGEVAAPGDTCFMLYTGKLKSNGKMFDSTSKHDDQPFSFLLGGGQVIKGWDVGVKGMKVGGKRTLEIPAELGYGAKGAGDDIPPNSDLVFDIQLLGVVKPDEADTVLRETLTPGTGPAAKAGDVVSIKYKGMLLNDKTFDDNGGKPVQITLGKGALSIPGLELAVTGMKKGQTILATIPPALGLQQMGPPNPKVPANSALKFEITLVSIG